MSGSTLLEVFGDIVFRFTRSVTEHYNPEEPEFTAESFGYDPVQSTGREWYYLPVDELIYQEYSDKDITSFAYLASSSLDVQVINACLPEESTEEGNKESRQEEDKEMAWKRLRPPVLQTIVKSMYIGGLISLLAASIVGTIYTLLSYLNYKMLCYRGFQKSRINFRTDTMDEDNCRYNRLCPLLRLPSFKPAISFSATSVKRDQN